MRAWNVATSGYSSQALNAPEISRPTKVTIGMRTQVRPDGYSRKTSTYVMNTYTPR